MVRSATPPVEELVVSTDHPQAFPNQNTREPSAILLVIVKQFHQLLSRVKLLAIIVQALQ